MEFKSAHGIRILPTLDVHPAAYASIKRIDFKAEPAKDPSSPFDGSKIPERLKNIYALSAMTRAAAAYKVAATHVSSNGRISSAGVDKLGAGNAKTNIINTSMKPIWGMNGWNAATGVNSAVGLAVALQYGIDAGKNICSYRNGERRDQNFAGGIANIAQSLNGVAFGMRGFNTLIAELGWEKFKLWQPVAHEWGSGTLLNAIYGIGRGVSRSFQAQHDIADAEKKGDFDKSNDIKMIAKNYSWGVGGVATTAIFTANEVLPYQWSGHPILWASWLGNRFGNYFQKASKFEYFGIKEDSNGNYVLNTINNNERNIYADFAHTVNDYGAQVFRALIRKPTEITQIWAGKNDKQNKLLNEMSETHEKVRRCFNWVGYTIATGLAVNYLSRFRPLYQLCIDKRVRDRIAYATKNNVRYEKVCTTFLNKAELLLNSTCAKTWTRCVSAYVGFNAFHASSQTASGIANHYAQTRVDVLHKDLEKNRDINLNPRLMSKTGFFDDAVAGKVTQFLYKNRIAKYLNADSRELKTSKEVNNVYVDATNSKQCTDRNPFFARVAFMILPLPGYTAYKYTQAPIEVMNVKTQNTENNAYTLK